MGVRVPPPTRREEMGDKGQGDSSRRSCSMVGTQEREEMGNWEKAWITEGRLYLGRMTWVAQLCSTARAEERPPTWHRGSTCRYNCWPCRQVYRQ